MLIEQNILTLSIQLFVFIRSIPGTLFKHAAKMLRMLKPKFISNLTYRFA